MTPRMKLFSNRMDRTENNKEIPQKFKLNALQTKTKKKLKI